MIRSMVKVSHTTEMVKFTKRVHSKMTFSLKARSATTTLIAFQRSLKVLFPKICSMDLEGNTMEMVILNMKDSL